jgi:cytidylate kinase
MKLSGLGKNIATAGLTAAGKTTHGKLLAAALGYEYVSATQLFLKHLKMTAEKPEGLWFRAFDEIEKARADDSVDDAVESELRQLASERSHTVFDTWALPWITDLPMLRIWFESDVESRNRKSYVSQFFSGIDRKLTLDECLPHISAKDDTTRERFLRRHKFDLFSDHECFDIRVTNSSLIPDPSVQCARAGIRTLSSVLLHASLYSLLETDEDKAALELLDPDEIFINSKWW